MPALISNIVYTTGIALYGAAIALASPFNEKAALLRKGRKKSFSILETKVNPNLSYVWFHAASLGEFEQGRPVLEALKVKHPELPILLTFFSPSGYEIRKSYAGADVICYLPADTRSNAVKLLNSVNVKAALFIKYEFWAHYLSELERRGIPVYSFSAIFRSNQLFFKSYGGWYLRLLNSFRKIYVQDEQSLQLLNEFKVQQAQVAGDTRFDRVAALATSAKSFPLVERFIGKSDSVIVAGSSWPADEELLARYIQEHPDTRLILVPHEINEAHLQGISKKFPESLRYTRLNGDATANTNCLVIDTIGMLSSIYQYATIAYIGGGFGVGIHNTLEAAVWEVPVVFGPAWHKFREAADLIKLGAGFSIADYDELRDCFHRLHDDTRAGKIAGDYVKRNTGASALIIEQLTNDLYAKTIDS